MAKSVYASNPIRVPSFSSTSSGAACHDLTIFPWPTLKGHGVLVAHDQGTADKSLKMETMEVVHAMHLHLVVLCLALVCAIPLPF